MNKTLLYFIGGGAVLVIGGAFLLNTYILKQVPEPVACTQEAMLCPDGSAVGRTGPNCEFAECPEGAAFGDSIILAIGEEMKFSDGLAVSLVEINDSRCPEGVVCIWAGELSPMFRITGGNAGKSLKEIRLGTATVANVTENGYTFILQEANTTMATIMVINGAEEVSLREGQREGSLLVQKIYPDYVTGLNFWEYPVATDQGSPITLRIGEIASNGCTITLTLIRIQGDTATFIKNIYFNRPCPICLAEHTLIDTPFGGVAVQNLQKGDAVWTLNRAGERVAGIVLETAKTPVPATHQVVHIILEDGRELFASPGHPITDGRVVGDLAPGDFYDGTSVVNAELVAYGESATYDILPSGDTGFYWANGILLDSALH